MITTKLTILFTPIILLVLLQVKVGNLEFLIGQIEYADNKTPPYIVIGVCVGLFLLCTIALVAVVGALCKKRKQ
jgi:hypothetical protein